MSDWTDISTEFLRYKKYDGLTVEVPVGMLMVAAAFTDIYAMMSVGDASVGAQVLAAEFKQLIKNKYPEEYQKFYVDPMQEEDE